MGILGFVLTFKLVTSCLIEFFVKYYYGSLVQCAFQKLDGIYLLLIQSVPYSVRALQKRETILHLRASQ